MVALLPCCLVCIVSEVLPGYVADRQKVTHKPADRSFKIL